MSNTMSLLQAQVKYGEIHNGVWGKESQWCEIVEIPAAIGENWLNSATGFSTFHIYCNKDFAPLLLQALHLVADRGLLAELKTFDGCFSIRDVRAAPGSVSCHSYGLAIDINAHENEMGHPSEFSPEFVACFTDVGLTWGGNFTRRTDPMHFSVGW